MVKYASLIDLEIQMGKISYINEEGVWTTRPVTDDDIRLYNRDRLISSIKKALMTLTIDIGEFSIKSIDYLRPVARKLCYSKSDDLGLVFDTAIYLCNNSLSLLFSENTIELIAEKCLESGRADLLEQYQDVFQVITSYTKNTETIFKEYIQQIADIIGMSDDSNILILANTLGRFPLFYSINQFLSKIEPKISDVVKNDLCIYENNTPLSEDDIEAVSAFYSKIKYRIDAFIRKMQGDLEPLYPYYYTPIDKINREEHTNFSSSFHYYIYYRLIPNMHYYGIIKPRVPDWVFTPHGRELYYAMPEYAEGIKRVLKEALSLEPSQAIIIEKGDIRFCFDQNRYELVFGNKNMYALSDFHILSEDEKLERFRNSSSEQIVVPAIVVDECNKMLSKLNTGKRIDNYVLRQDYNNIG